MDVLLMLLVSVLYILSPVHSDTCQLICQNGGTLSKECEQCDCVKGYTGDQCELGDVLLTLVVDTTEMFLGLAFTMSCKMANARGFGANESKVEFQRVGLPILLAYVLQKGANCSAHSSLPWMKPKCGAGTDDVSSHMKIYIMEITEVKKSDVVEWACSITYPNITPSNSIHFKLLALKLTMSAKSKDAVKNLPFILTCKLEHPTSGVVRGTIQILRQTLIFAKLRQEGPNCTVITGNSKEYNYKCGNGTDQVGSRVKIYIMEFVRLAPRDKADWLCRIENGDKSNIFSMPEFTPCPLKCENGGSPNDDCDKCNCFGHWEGSACRKCGFACLNGGTVVTNCTECRCLSGFKGPICSDVVDDEEPGSDWVLIAIIVGLLLLLLIIIIIIIIWWKRRRQQPTDGQTLDDARPDAEGHSTEHTVSGSHSKSKRRQSRLSSMRGRKSSKSPSHQSLKSLKSLKSSKSHKAKSLEGQHLKSPE
ncbi:uncharacterized protein LOC121373296 isoform X2 [Gigantopelta aegis]|uniref:uncharacterized protein LOC121373296 isoform X2 n=1 Tax=Gigantopelta aegis TaxID=1735272 RepID=UPI001B88C999|nr:uncharacterized protein LOC121373296 isoform X2 [Gigantopelta aegis]